jgi:hypothetical protein
MLWGLFLNQNLMPVQNNIYHQQNYFYLQSKQQEIAPSRGNMQNMLDALGERETGKPKGDIKQYSFENPHLGFLGKYQFAEVLLIRLGYYQATVYYGNGADKNYWRGSWTNKRGINSKVKFLNSPQAQETAIREAFGIYLEDINYFLKSQGKSLSSYLNKNQIFNYQGKSKTIKITLSGILAGAHLRGPNRVVELLTQGKISKDEFGTSILEYIDMFANYSVSQTIEIHPNIFTKVSNLENLP